MTRGVREELQARIALERGVVSPEKEKDRPVDINGETAAAGAAGLNGEASSPTKGEGGGGDDDGGAKLTKRKKGKKQTRRRLPGPKVSAGMKPAAPGSQRPTPGSLPSFVGGQTTTGSVCEKRVAAADPDPMARVKPPTVYSVSAQG